MAKRTPRLEAYEDILVTAVEGGINYWFSVARWDGSKAVGYEDDGEDKPAKHTITVATVRKGINILAKGGGYDAARGRYEETPQWWKDKWREAYEGCATLDWDYDAGDADVIIQVGLLGEVVYG